MAGKVTRNGTSQKAASELVETLVCTDNDKYYHITKPFQVRNGRMKFYLISQTAAHLNNLRFNKGILWTVSALVSLSLWALIAALLGGLL